MQDINQKIYHRILHTQQYQGIQSRCFNFFNKHLKGLRKGELTILTGASGSGKTTFMSQLSIDFLAQGLPTLWGSFEIVNEVLGQSMVQ